MFVEQPLGVSTWHRVDDTRLVAFAQQTAMQLNDASLRRYPSFRFPGSLPVTIEKRHKSTVRMGAYRFTPKADGVRHALCFFTYYTEGDWQRMCVALSRDGGCWLLRVETCSDVYEDGGSLFDAELVLCRSSGCALFLLFDCYAYQGANLRSLPLARRLAKCEHLERSSTCRQEDSARLVAKPYYKLCRKHADDADAFMRNANHYLQYDTDGIVLVPPGASECTHGRDETQFKLKPEHTIDLILMSEHAADHRRRRRCQSKGAEVAAAEVAAAEVDAAKVDAAEVEAADAAAEGAAVEVEAADAADAGAGESYFLASYNDASDAYVPKQQLSALRHQAQPGGDTADAEAAAAAAAAAAVAVLPIPEGASAAEYVNCVFETRVVLVAEGIVKYVPLKLRPDKDRPNTETTVARTLSTIRDDVRVEDLMTR